MVLCTLMNSRTRIVKNGGIIVSIVAFMAGSSLCRSTHALANEDLRLPRPSFPAVVDLHEAGRTEEALTALERAIANTEDAPLEARLLRAALLDGLGRTDESERTWVSVADDEPILRTFALTTLVANLADHGEAARAEDHLNALTQGRPGRQHMALLLMVADAHRTHGDRAAALRLYRRGLQLQRSGGSADRARMGLALTQESAGDAEAALALYREAQLRSRTADVFIESRAAERRLAGALGRQPDPFSETPYREHVRRLRDASRYVAALDLLDDWQAAHPDTAQADVIALERIDTLYAMRNNAEAVRQCFQFSERYPAHGELPRVRLVRFRLAVREARTDDVRQLGRALFEGRVRGASAGIRRDAGVLLAAYLVAVGEVEDGLAVYRRLFREARTDSDRRTILWRAGVAALRVGQFERAATNLRGLIRRNPPGELEPAALYWVGVAEQRLGRLSDALGSFRALARRYPYHYYGLRAVERLADPSLAADGGQANPSEPRLDFPTLTVSTATRGQARFRAATVLARAGLLAAAADHAQQLLESRRRDTALALLTARALADAGEYARVSVILTNHFGAFLRQPADGLPSDFWQLVYPRPYLDTVQAAAEAHGVDSLLLYSLMRQESRFDPDARSAVGALGLFQIMPYTAAEIGPAAGVGDVSDQEAALLQPSVNAAIGATLMSHLLAMFDGAIPPVAASYNAGEDLAVIWWRAASDLPLDQFVDSIPYSQTRRFVREILTNYASYQRLYGQTTP